MEDSRNDYLLRWEQLKVLWEKFLRLVKGSVEKESTRAKKAEAEISKTLEDEISRASLTHEELLDKITKEIARATGREDILGSSIEELETLLRGEISRAEAAEGELSTGLTTLSQKITAETTRATGEEKKLGDAIANLKKNTEIDISSLLAQVTQEVEDRKAALEETKSALQAENELLRQMIINAGNDLATETRERKEADKALRDDLNAEIERATTAEDGLMRTKADNMFITDLMIEEDLE